MNRANDPQTESYSEDKADWIQLDSSSTRNIAAWCSHAEGWRRQFDPLDTFCDGRMMFTSGQYLGGKLCAIGKLPI